MKRGFIQVVDDFYSDPYKVRQRGLEAGFNARGKYKLGLSTRAIQPRGIKKLIEKRFRLRIKYWEDISNLPGTENGSFFTTFSRGKRSDDLTVHYDRLSNMPNDRSDNGVVFIVYMTPAAPFNAGTSMWQHRKTGLTSGPTKSDALRLKTSIDELERILERDAYEQRRWEEIDRVGNVFNRALMIPSRTLHSATSHFGSNLASGRIIQVYTFQIDPSPVF